MEHQIQSTSTHFLTLVESLFFRMVRWTALSLAGIGINIYTASLSRDEYRAMAEIERKNMEALDQVKIDQDAREVDQDEMSLALAEYYHTVVGEFLSITVGTGFHDELLAKNEVASIDDLLTKNFEHLAAVGPELKIYLDNVSYQILELKVRQDTGKASDVTHAVDFLTGGDRTVDWLYRRLYLRADDADKFLTKDDLAIIKNEFSEVTTACSAGQDAPGEELFDYLTADDILYIYDFADACFI